MLTPKEHLYHSSDIFFEDLIDYINSAQISIDIEYYLISNDTVGKTFFEALRDAKDRGVNIRFIVDGWGSHEFLPVLIDWANKYQIDLNVHNPPIWVHEAFPDLSHIFKINQRTHRKLVIIDNETVFTGSINLSSEHFKLFSGPSAWLDIGLRIEDERVLMIKNVFEASWESQVGFGLSNDSRSKLPDITSSVRANQTRLHRYNLYLDLINRINKAKKEIVIVNPYFVPSKKLSAALRNAALRDVQIKIILPHKSDLKLFPWFNSMEVRNLDRYGVIFYEYLPTILHSKITIIDDFYMIGSSNWNTRSFYHDRELDIEILCNKTKTSIDLFIEKVFIDSRKICYKTIRQRFSKYTYAKPFYHLLRYWI
jgi:cardiolipin synthase